MEGFLFISSANKQRENYSDEIKNLINNMKSVNHYFHIINEDNITLIYYTNETSEYPYTKSNDYMFCPIGQYTVSKQELERKMINQTDEENRKTIQDLAGTFLVAKDNLKSKSIDVYTHITRIENAYLYESNEVIVIGSDPLIVSGVSNRNMKPIFDSKNFTSFFELGYFGDENTPFDGVKAVPAN